MAKHSVLIIECRDKGEEPDPGSEGRFIKHMLDLMEVPNDFQRARSKSGFVELLSSVSADTDVVHIATHGRVTPDGPPNRFVGFWTPDKQHVTMEEIGAAHIDFAGKTVVSTACLSGRKTPREAFKMATGCKHYIAPKREPTFNGAALMCHIFYHKHLALRRRVKKAFREYEDRYRNPHGFCLS